MNKKREAEILVPRCDVEDSHVQGEAQLVTLHKKQQDSSVDELPEQLDQASKARQV